VIPIRNIYYMLSYAFQVLDSQGYKDLATEEFENVGDLCAAILITGVSLQMKRGLSRDYVERTAPLSSLRGKIGISESIKTQSMLKKQMVCSYDDFSIDSAQNRILKSTMVLLLHSDVAKARKKALKKLLVFFSEVTLIESNAIDWHVHYDRNNQTYRMLVSICYLVVKGLLEKQDDGTMRMMDFLDEQRMSHLYEKFILEFYRKELPLLSANPSQIPWMLDGEGDAFLPLMQSDITLSRGNNVLIIDAKYYNQNTQVRFGAHTIHSHNLYQIFTYVKNKEVSFGSVPHQVSGMLLYAKTDETIQPDSTYVMSGNRISVKTLDLNQKFSDIADQLKRIAKEYFGNEA